MTAKIIQSCNYYGNNSRLLVAAFKGILNQNHSIEEWIILMEKCINDTIEDNTCFYSLFQVKFEVVSGTTSDGIKYIRILSNTVDRHRVFVIMTITFEDDPTP